MIGQYPQARFRANTSSKSLESTNNDQKRNDVSMTSEEGETKTPKLTLLGNISSKGGKKLVILNSYFTIYTMKTEIAVIHAIFSFSEGAIKRIEESSLLSSIIIFFFSLGISIFVWSFNGKVLIGCSSSELLNINICPLLKRENHLVRELNWYLFFERWNFWARRFRSIICCT